MIESKLFLGFSVDSEFARLLKSTSPQIVDFFLNEEGDYLREVIFQNERYVGKFAGETIDMASLELLESNVYSLLKKLVPAYDCEKVRLRLFPVLH